MDRLNFSFFNRNTVKVALELLGKELVFGEIRGIITETEAYRGYDDPASHSYKGPTARSKIMFDKAGNTYVYLIYGMYHCLNIVTEEEGVAGAVLIRGLTLLSPNKITLAGPGKLCKHLGINKTHNNINLINASDFYIRPGVKIDSYDATPRIGIKMGTDKLWRFCAK